MPVVPKESLPKKMPSFKESKTRLKNMLSDKVYLYAIFIILVLELVSLFLRNEENYVSYWYPLLAQVELFVVVFSTFLKSDEMRFCQRRKIAFIFLSIYFAFGATSIIIGIYNQIYLDIATFLLLGGTFVSMILTLFQNKK